ncbi:hypothetical protein I8H89_00395 [Candidatus Saccharibacteria bacterium]|nr:hypothetical protein [Candidatus Saccharibacteria bacterium]
MENPLQNERATKKQKELLNFIDGFIKGNGYGPSYREVMRALEYKSVSTVAAHVDGLIARGYLEKTSTSARSLAVVKQLDRHQTREQWLAQELKTRRHQFEGVNSAEAVRAIESIDRVAALFDITL